MPSVIHVVVTDAFAGVERYVCTVATATAARGWKVTVVGGDPGRMRHELGPGVTWRPGATPLEAARSVMLSGRAEVCHAHMTAAEAVAVATRRRHRGRLVSTRHFAAHRGASRLGGLLAPWIQRHLDVEIAISDFVADRLERRPSVTVLNGVPDSEVLWRKENRTVLVMQRLEPEKDTVTALHAWAGSGLADDGWVLRILGDGSQRAFLERLMRVEGIAGVTFAGQVRDVRQELGRAGLLLASAPAEPFGLGVVEAMAAGVPVVAAAAGGHLETAGQVPGSVTFEPGDADSAAAGLKALAKNHAGRGRLAEAGRAWQREHAGAEATAEAVIASYRMGRPRSGERTLVSLRGYRVGTGCLDDQVIRSG